MTLDEQTGLPAPEPQKQIVADAARIIGSGVIGQVLGVLRGFIVPKIFAPVDFGLWQLINLTVQYSAHLHLGAFRAMSRQIPILTAEAKEAELRRTRQTALWFTVLLSAIAAAGIMLYAAWGPMPGGASGRITLAICAVALIAQQFYSYHYFQLRSFAKFKLSTRREIISHIVLFVGVISLAPLIGLPGMALAVLASFTAGSLALARESPYEKPGIDWVLLRKLLAIGIPLFLSPLLVMSMTAVGQMLVAWKLSLAAAGYYGLGVALSGMFYWIPNAVAVALYPRMLTDFGRHKNPALIGDSLARVQPVVSAGMPVLVGLVIIPLEAVLYLWLPKYLPGLPAIKLLLAGIVFMAQALLAVNVLAVVGWFWKIPLIQGSAFALSTLGVFAALHLGGSLELVTVIISAANICYSLATVFTAFRACGRGNRQAARPLAESLLPALWSALFLVPLHWLWPTTGTAAQVLVKTALVFAAFLVWAAPLVIFVYRRARREGLL